MFDDVVDELEVFPQEDVASVFGNQESRWCQIAAHNGIVRELEISPTARVLLKMPTGVGKTHSIGLVLLSSDIRNALNITGRPMRVVFFAHMHRLLTQAERAYLSESGVSVIDVDGKGNVIHQPARNANTVVEVYFTTIFTAVPPSIDGVDLIVIDEAHHEASFSYQLSHARFGHLPHVMTTATDGRLDRMMIKVDAIVEPISREQAVAEGMIARSTIHTVVDLTGRDKSAIINKLIGDYHEDMGSTIAFLRTKAEAKKVEQFIKDNIPHKRVVMLDKQSPNEINKILDDFSDGKVDVIVNCHRLGEGIDVKKCQSVIIGKNLQSYVTLNQMIGRSARPDCESHVWELVNPLSDKNLNSTVVVGTPEDHYLYWIENTNWKREEFKEHTIQVL